MMGTITEEEDREQQENQAIRATVDKNKLLADMKKKQELVDQQKIVNK